MRKHHFLLLILLFTFCLVAVSCSLETGSPKNKNAQEKKSINNERVGTNEPQQGGTITIAMNESPGGVFNPIFYEDAYEKNILDFTHESLVSQNDHLEFTPHLARKWKINEEQTEITFYLEKDVKWHDGEAFTADDVVFTYQTMANPDYISSGGIQTAYVEPLIGYQDYQTKQTNHFDGVIANDDYTVTFQFEEPNVNPLYIASFPIIPAHIFADIPVTKISETPASQEPDTVIGTGPFKFTKMEKGEQYELERNNDYWQGKPYLDKVVWKVMDHSIMPDLLISGELDLIAEPDGMPPADAKAVENNTSIGILEQPGHAYQFLGFKHHYRPTDDVEKGLFEPSNWVPNDKLSDPKVRQAIAYAVNREELIDTLLYGHGQLIHSPIASQSWANQVDSIIKYRYDPDKTRSMLDKAGYVDIDGDGFRENPDGGEWILNMDYPMGNELREKNAPFIRDQLEAVGIQVNLRQPKEMTTYLKELMNDHTDWDLYLFDWNFSVGEPNPTGFWGTKAPYNFSRWNNSESDALLEKGIKTTEAFDQGYRAKIYNQWQTVFTEDLPVLLLYTPNHIWAYNKRLHGLNHPPHLWWVK